MNKKIMRRLFNIAKLTEKVGGCRVVAALVVRNKVLSIGVNSKNSCFLARRFYKHNSAICNHAEISAISQLVNSTNNRLRGLTLYVCRAKKVNGHWNYGLAKPCDGCEAAIRHFGISKVFWSHDGVNIYGDK